MDDHLQLIGVTMKMQLAIQIEGKFFRNGKEGNFRTKRREEKKRGCQSNVTHFETYACRLLPYALTWSGRAPHITE